MTKSERGEREQRSEESGADELANAEATGEGNGPVSDGAAGEDVGVEDMGVEVAEVESELDQVQAELKALEERHLRLAAEFDNYRKRNERERTEHRARSQAQVVAELLDALDDLERVAHVDPESATVDALLEGVQLVERKLRRSLEAAGLEVLNAEGAPFDPNTMDALMTVPTSVEEDEDVVADVFQKGYRFKDLLVRPAKVRVKKYDPDAEAEDV